MSDHAPRSPVDAARCRHMDLQTSCLITGALGPVPMSHGVNGASRCDEAVRTSRLPGVRIPPVMATCLIGPRNRQLLARDTDRQRRMSGVAITALRRGEHAGAAALIAEGLRLFQAAGDRRGAADCLDLLAEVAGARQDHARVARLGGAAAAAREVLGAPAPAAMRELCWLPWSSVPTPAPLRVRHAAASPA
jgi:hypothetical protein